MSYRLIDSNAIAIKYPEVNEMPCVFADLPDGLNGQFIDAQSEQQWIPCSDRLPEEEGEYLITDDSGGIKTIEVDSFMFYEDGTKDWFYSQNAIAWMPLPKPYGGGRA